MTIEPVHAPMGFQVGLFQHAPDRRAAHCPARRVGVECGRDIIEAPPRSWAAVGSWCTGGDRQNVDLFSGEKRRGRPLGGASWSPASPCSRYRERQRPTVWRSQRISAATRRLGGCVLAPRPAASADTERPRPGGSNAHANELQLGVLFICLIHHPGVQTGTWYKSNP